MELFLSPVDKPTEKCALKIVIPKPNGKVRVCVGLTMLNQYFQCGNQRLQSGNVTLGKLAGDKYCSFSQIKLSENSRLLITFIASHPGVNVTSVFFHMELAQGVKSSRSA